MGTVRYTMGLRMVSPRVVTYFILGVLTTTTQARRPKLVQSDRSGSCPTEGGKACVFPFKTACTTAKGPCKFPFLYKGKEYNNCTLYQSSGNRPWCATALKADGNMQKWANCDMEVCTDPHAVGGPYSECVPSVTTEGKGWCATAVNEDGIFTTRDFCSNPDCVPTTTTTTTTVATTADPSICKTEGGNQCQFPFNTVCTTSKGPCMFPFLYKGKKYINCTLYQASGGNPWCATSLRSDGNMQQWANCDMDVCTVPNGVIGPFGQCIPSSVMWARAGVLPLWIKMELLQQKSFVKTLHVFQRPKQLPPPPPPLPQAPPQRILTAGAIFLLSALLGFQALFTTRQRISWDSLTSSRVLVVSLKKVWEICSRS